MRFLLPLIFLTSCASRSKPTICEYLKLDNCNNSKRSLSRSAGSSLPSVNSAAFNNPAAIALNKGIGIESIHYQGKAQLGIVTGTGRIGAAISNNPSEGTFFGNTPPETINEYRERKVNSRIYENNKISFATAFNIFGAKKKKGLQLDLGVIYKRQTEIEEDFFGGGLILSYNKFLSIGFSKYSDIHYADFRNQDGFIYDQFGNATEVIYPNTLAFVVENRFNVTTSVVGLKFSNIALDYMSIITEFVEDIYDKDIRVDIYNLSYFYKKWILSYGRRFEQSFQEVYDPNKEEFIIQEDKSDSFLGAQYATNNGFLLGIFHNYYLFDEISLGLTYFF